MKPRRPTNVRTYGVAALASFALACSPRSAGDVVPAPIAPAPPQVAPPPPPPAPYVSLGSAPPDGPPNEYDEMMELVRAQFSRPNDPLEMTMLSYRRIGDWARVRAQSHVPGRRDDSDSMYVYSSLFRKVDGAWTLIETDCGEGGNPACEESLKLASFMKRVPQAPPELAPTPPPTKGKPGIHGQFGETTFQIAFEDLPSLVPLAKGETFKIAELARDATSSYHVVALLEAEPLHKHVAHDLMVVLLEGQGEMRVGDWIHPMGPRSIVHVPRGVKHSMRNTLKTPQIAYAVFTPPFDGKDRVAVDR